MSDRELGEAKWGPLVIDNWEPYDHGSEYVVHWDEPHHRQHLNISFAGDEVAVMVDKHDALALIKQLQAAVKEMV